MKSFIKGWYIERGQVKAACVMFILAGIKPLASRVSLASRENWSTPSDGRQLRTREVLLTIRARDFSWRELQRIYSRIRKELTPLKEMPIKEKDIRIYRLIQELGEPPVKKGKRWPYWQNALKKWSLLYHRERPQTEQGLQSAWKKIKKFRSQYEAIRVSSALAAEDFIRD